MQITSGLEKITPLFHHHFAHKLRPLGKAAMRKECQSRLCLFLDLAKC